MYGQFNMQMKPVSSDMSSLEDATTNIQFTHIAAKPSLELVVQDENSIAGSPANYLHQQEQELVENDQWTKDCLMESLRKHRGSDEPVLPSGVESTVNSIA